MLALTDFTEDIPGLPHVHLGTMGPVWVVTDLPETGIAPVADDPANLACFVVMIDHRLDPESATAACTHPALLYHSGGVLVRSDAVHAEDRVSTTGRLNFGSVDVAQRADLASVGSANPSCRVHMELIVRLGRLALPAPPMRYFALVAQFWLVAVPAVQPFGATISALNAPGRFA